MIFLDMLLDTLLVSSVLAERTERNVFNVVSSKCCETLLFVEAELTLLWVVVTLVALMFDVVLEGSGNHLDLLDGFFHVS